MENETENNGYMASQERENRDTDQWKSRNSHEFGFKRVHSRDEAAGKEMERNGGTSRGEKEKGCPFGGMVCQVTQRDVMEYLVKGSKPDWCPIRTIPEKKLLTGVVSSAKAVGDELVRAGWNACLDEIEGNGVE